MNDLNYVLVTGKLTRDPEIKMLTADTPLCQFTIAINRYYKRKDDTKYSTDASYFFVESWGDLADNSAQYLKKGRVVRIIGHLKQTRWADKANGEKPRERTYIVAEHIEFGSLPQSKAPQIMTESESLKTGMDNAVASGREIDEHDKAAAEEVSEESDL